MQDSNLNKYNNTAVALPVRHVRPGCAPAADAGVNYTIFYRESGSPHGSMFEAGRFTTEDTESKEGMMENDPFTGRIIGCAIEVHRVLGPGLLESTYQQFLAHELNLNAIPFKLEHPMPVEYKGVHLDCGYRLDVLVDDRLILELKAVEAVNGIHKAQLLTYMKLSGIKTGLLIDFNVQRLADGIERFKL